MILEVKNQLISFIGCAEILIEITARFLLQEGVGLEKFPE
ncbi:hypothetical protein SAMN04490178_11864 [Propionispora vibrioides]|uniref:Uncharacterized protein n=1 Tax=Propionispora vibrioides TaxID=112903 RepID=A0A1H8WW30_9FIRM|nr:hypothetical protein SAMN04490178_11864 [Propionispora vibrioides]